MPKKKKATKKKGKKSSKEGKSKAALEAVGPTELELSLRLELSSLEAELTRAKSEAEEARVQNEWLGEEVQKTRDETQDYQIYMQKKTMREHAKIQGLSDQNQRELDHIEAEKQRRSLEYQQNKKDLQDRILDKEGELQRINTQLGELIEFKRKRDKQENEVRDLNAKIKQLEDEHTESLQQLKASFLDAKITFQNEATMAVKELEQEASTEAMRCLDVHSGQVKSENKALRADLLRLFSRNKALRERELMLKNQNKDLGRQLELNIDISDKQNTRMQRRLTRTLSNSGRGGFAMV